MNQIFNEAKEILRMRVNLIILHSQLEGHLQKLFIITIKNIFHEILEKHQALLLHIVEIFLFLFGFIFVCAVCIKIFDYFDHDFDNWMVVSLLSSYDDVFLQFE